MKDNIEHEQSRIEEQGIIINSLKPLPCAGNSCGDIKVKVVQGYPDVPIAKVKNTSENDIEIKIEWRNMIGSGKTTHVIWAGETERIEGPHQYWGVSAYEANKH